MIESKSVCEWMYIQHGRDIEHLLKQTISPNYDLYQKVLKFFPALVCLIQIITIKSAERLVEILEVWSSNLFNQIDYPGLGKYVSCVLSGH